MPTIAESIAAKMPNWTECAKYLENTLLVMKLRVVQRNISVIGNFSDVKMLQTSPRYNQPIWILENGIAHSTNEKWPSPTHNLTWTIMYYTFVLHGTAVVLVLDVVAQFLAGTPGTLKE